MSSKKTVAKQQSEPSVAELLAKQFLELDMLEAILESKCADTGDVAQAKGFLGINLAQVVLNGTFPGEVRS